MSTTKSPASGLDTELEKEIRETEDKVRKLEAIMKVGHRRGTGGQQIKESRADLKYLKRKRAALRRTQHVQRLPK